jgi:hypothetical protein
VAGRLSTRAKTRAQAFGKRTLGWTAEIVRHPPKPAPEEVMIRWMRELDKEGIPADPKKFVAHKGPRPFLPKRRVVERTFSLRDRIGG